MMNDDTVSIREAANIAGVSERWIRVAVKGGSLPASQEEMGEIYAWRIKRSDLDVWMQRTPSPRGKATDVQSYIVTIPPHKSDQLVHAISKIEGATLRRNKHKDYLVGGSE